MFVVYNKESGWTDENMRFEDREDAEALADRLYDETGAEHLIRHEPEA